MRNYVQPGITLTIPAPANYLSGDVAVVGALAGVVASDVVTGGDLDLTVEGVFNLPKVSALAIAVGDIVYWDSTAKLVNKTASGNTKLGIATSAAPNPSGTVDVRLGVLV